MKISADLTPQAYEFACHSKACAPPPAGHGGSIAGPARGVRPAILRGKASTSTVKKVSPSAYLNVGGKMTPVSVKRYGKWRDAGKPTIYNQAHLDRVTGRRETPHVSATVHRDPVYTSLKGSHVIRKSASGGFVIHTKNARPQRLAKHTAEHIKALDDHKTTAAEDVLGRIARWKAKG